MTTYMDLNNAYNDHLGTATPLKLWSILSDLKRRGIVDFDANAGSLENAEQWLRAPPLGGRTPLEVMAEPGGPRGCLGTADAPGIRHRYASL